MAEEAQHTIWPLSKFSFKVSFGLLNSTFSFQEVSGLDTETQAIEYRHSDSKIFSTIKMPGIANFSKVTLKNGIVEKDTQFFNWYSAFKMNTMRREPITIQLVDEQGNPALTWKLANGWPSKMTIADLTFDHDNVIVETMELVHEGITMVDG